MSEISNIIKPLSIKEPLWFEPNSEESLIFNKKNQFETNRHSKIMCTLGCHTSTVVFLT